MIDARELRIGNNVYGVKNKVGTISNIFDYFAVGLNFGRKPQRIRYKIEDINSIPLTEELLLKCGFEENELFQTHGFRKNWFSLSPEPTCSFCYMINYNKLIYVEVKYLHQLQNLYYALTGEELEVKEG